MQLDLTVFANPDSWASLLTLTLMEIVLGIDNIVFLSILTGRLPVEEQPRARKVGLIMAMGMRLALLVAISWVMQLTNDLFRIDVLTFHKGFSGRDLILVGGGLFLMAKAVHEIFDKLEVEHAAGEEKKSPKRTSSFVSVILQITVMDIVFSLDSVITAVGMARHLAIMIAAVVVSVGVMLIFAGGISRFVNRHPSMKILALSFLILIGVMLMVEGMGGHVDKGYIYFAMAFALGVELVNLKLRKRQRPVHLHGKFEDEKETTGAS